MYDCRHKAALALLEPNIPDALAEAMWIAVADELQRWLSTLGDAPTGAVAAAHRALRIARHELQAHRARIARAAEAPSP